MGIKRIKLNAEKDEMEIKGSRKLINDTFAIREIGLDSLLTSSDQQNQKFPDILSSQFLRQIT